MNHFFNECTIHFIIIVKTWSFYHNVLFRIIVKGKVARCYKTCFGYFNQSLQEVRTKRSQTSARSVPILAIIIMTLKKHISVHKKTQQSVPPEWRFEGSFPHSHRAEAIQAGDSIIFKIRVFYKAWFEGFEFFIRWPYKAVSDQGPVWV